MDQADHIFDYAHTRPSELRLATTAITHSNDKVQVYGSYLHYINKIFALSNLGLWAICRMWGGVSRELLTAYAAKIWDTDELRGSSSGKDPLDVKEEQEIEQNRDG